ncbi:MAG: hypothetical protein GY801_43905 [bacterium]|nr:hypothetical protein [bacterium]
MKKFFRRLLPLLLSISLAYTLFLSAPFGLFFYSFHALNESEDAIALELHPLSGLIVFEDTSTTAEAELVSNQTLTYALSDEILERKLSAYFAKRSIPGIVLESLTATIAPEMLSLQISWQCELLGYRFYKNTVFSEWGLRVARVGEVKRIEIKPSQLHSNHLYSVNLAEYWKYAPWVTRSDGWFALDSTSRLNIQELVLQDGEVALTLGATPEVEL